MNFMLKLLSYEFVFFQLDFTPANLRFSLFFSSDNRTDLYALEIDSKYLNNFKNISNSAPEVIDYYDLDVSIDDVMPSVPPEIYPDPQKIYTTKEHTTSSGRVDVPKPDIKDLIGEDAKNDDLKAHDAIDNIMYIYYGSNNARRKSLGGSIIVVGTVFALAAQILAIVLSIIRNRWVSNIFTLRGDVREKYVYQYFFAAVFEDQII